MSPTSNFFRASRPIFRSSQFFTSQRTAFRQNASKRFQSTAAPEGAAQESFFKRMWNSPVGFKTVHFWYAGQSLHS